VFRFHAHLFAWQRRALDRNLHFFAYCLYFDSCQMCYFYFES
jgi:hypothetical protein